MMSQYRLNMTINKKSRKKCKKKTKNMRPRIQNKVQKSTKRQNKVMCLNAFISYTELRKKKEMRGIKYYRMKLQWYIVKK